MILPVYNKMATSNNKSINKINQLSKNNYIIQAAIKSIIIQHGKNGAFRMLETISDEIKDEKTFLNALYQYRITKFPKYKKRYIAEYNELIRHLNTNT